VKEEHIDYFRLFRYNPKQPKGMKFVVTLTPVMKKIILHWGEMGSVWGINRTVAQMYALLYLSPDPLTADEISACLSIARSTVSTGLHELQAWGVVKTVNVLGDRRDYFTTMSDIWEIFRVILDERKRREIDPTLEMLQESVKEIQNQGGDQTHVADRVNDMLEFFETFTVAYEQFQRVPTSRLKELLRMSNKLTRMIEQAERS
jgi:DNA-binding transcriptional regulator GbsR (MarR family)